MEVCLELGKASNWRSASATTMAADTDMFKDRMPAAMGMVRRASAAVDKIGHARRLSSHDQDVAPLEGVFHIGLGCLGGHEDTPVAGIGGLEGMPIHVPGQSHVIQVIHAGAAHVLATKHEPTGLDNLTGHAEARAGAQYGGRVLRNIRLKKGQTEGRFQGSLLQGVFRPRKGPDSHLLSRHEQALALRFRINLSSP